MAERVLVVEDHPDLLEICLQALARAGYDVLPAGSAAEAREALSQAPYDIVVTDLKIPGASGLEILAAAKRADPETTVILITGYPTVDTAVNAMKSGAADYLVKPFTMEQLVGAVRAALETRQAREAYQLLRGQLRGPFGPGGFVGRSQPMLRVFEDIRRAAAVDSNVLILGASGTGKELVARTIHETSARRTGPYVPINCAAIPESLLEAELFGYERGAFTGADAVKQGLFEYADRGTLFLDEIGEMPLALQAKLLRALEERNARRLGGRKGMPFDVRFIAATNRDIRAEMRRRRFREDLFFRIDVVEILVPALTERREDVPLLAVHFLEATARQRRPKLQGISARAMDMLVIHDWPGNVRELRNAVERAAAYAKGPIVTPDDLPDAVRNPKRGIGLASLREWKEQMLERLERDFLWDTLVAHGGNVSRAARALRVDRSTLQRFMRRHSLPAA